MGRHNPVNRSQDAAERFARPFVQILRTKIKRSTSSMDSRTRRLRCDDTD